jgi:hypothetical protein
MQTQITIQMDADDGRTLACLGEETDRHGWAVEDGVALGLPAPNKAVLLYEDLFGRRRAISLGGRVTLTVENAAGRVSEQMALPLAVDGDVCPHCDNPARRLNAETIAAIEEAMRMTDDPTLGKRYADIEEWRAELYADV